MLVENWSERTYTTAHALTSHARVLNWGMLIALLGLGITKVRRESCANENFVPGDIRPCLFFSAITCDRIHVGTFSVFVASIYVANGQFSVYKGLYKYVSRKCQDAHGGR